MSAKLMIAISASLGIGITFAVVKFDTINVYVGPQFHQTETQQKTSVNPSTTMENVPKWMPGTFEDPSGPPGNNWLPPKEDPCGPTGNNWGICP